ncbi:hypothetical protein DSO57_1019415 [Entomophthora muscae]|uniref:Uncharacterized protein n=1 Tax=Entomophthora muscae TaxID=34485 RepID=A0ACC2RIQ1_9FUNG|nr:hypothetical protein DSO57_1019415 [Entomophthora muscae]
MQKSIQILLCTLLAQGSPTDGSSPNQIQRRSSNYYRAPAYNPTAQQPRFGNPAVSPAYNSAAQRPLYGKPNVLPARDLTPTSPPNKENGMDKPLYTSQGKQDTTDEGSGDDSDDDSDDDKPDIKSNIQNKPSAGSRASNKCRASGYKRKPNNPSAEKKPTDMAGQREIGTKSDDGSDNESDNDSDDESEPENEKKDEPSSSMPAAGNQRSRVAGNRGAYGRGYTTKPQTSYKGDKSPNYGAPSQTKKPNASKGRKASTSPYKPRKSYDNSPY